MKTITTWQCEICSVVFDAPEKAIACEARGRVELGGYPGLLWCRPEWPRRLFVVLRRDPNSTPHQTSWISLAYGEFQGSGWSLYAHVWPMHGWVPADLTVPWIQGALRVLPRVLAQHRADAALAALPVVGVEASS